MSLWQDVKFTDSSWYRWDVGPTTLWGKNIDDEFFLASDRVEEEKMDNYKRAAEPDKDEEIRRWILKREPLAIRPVPIMPDRPVVVRPESPIRFPPERSARIYVSIPVWVRMRAIQSDEIDLVDEPSRELSNIWFGDPMNGVLAYSLKIRARRNLSNMQPRVHRALCPVTIVNISDDELDFQRFCLRVEHLYVYGQDDNLWTSEMRVYFRGQDQVSRIEYGKKAPIEAPEAALLSKPRKPVRKSLFRQSFFSLFKIGSGTGPEE